MQSINLDELKKQAIATEPNNTNVTSLKLDDIKMIEENLQALFAENVNEIYMKTKWTRDETQKGYPTIVCKLTKNAIYMQQTKGPTDPIIVYKYHIKRDELIKNNTIVTGEGKTMFFKRFIKVIKWAEAEKLEVAFK